MPSSDAPPPWFEDENLSEATVDRFHDRPDGVGSFPDGAELSSSDEHGGFDEPAWHDDPAVRALFPTAEDEPANPPSVNDWPALEAPANDLAPQTSVFVNGVAMVVPLTRAQALARGYAVVDSDDELVPEPISNHTPDESESRSEPHSTGDSDATAPDMTDAPDIADAPDITDPTTVGDPPEAGFASDGTLTRFAEVESAVRDEAWPAAAWMPEGEPASRKPTASDSDSDSDSIPWWLASMGNQPPARAPEPPEVIPSPPLTVSGVEPEPSAQVSGTWRGEPVESAVPTINSGFDASMDRPLPSGPDPQPPVLERPVVAEPVVAEPVVAEPVVADQMADQLAEGAVSGDAPTLAGMAPDAADAASVLSWLRTLAPAESTPERSPSPVTPIEATIEMTGGSGRHPSFPTESNQRFSTGPWASPAPAIDASTPVIIEATGLGRTFRKGSRNIVVLHDIDLAIHRGEFVAITGPSGSGKTTLLHCLAGLDDLTAGSVVVDGFELHNLTDGERSRHRSAAMGFAFQSYNLVPSLTALENVELPLMLNDWPQDRSVDEARAALELVGLSDRADFQPDELSGGEQQRIAIARAFVGEPKVLWADEPTGNLDDATADQVLQVFRELNHSGLTIVMVTHDPALARLAHRVIELSSGEIRRVNERVPS